MPFGSYSALADIIHLLSLTNPASVLDLGIGNGMNGAAVRNYCGKTVRLVGVEVFAQYENPMWELYDRVDIMTIENYLELKKELFDAILLTDVIEHFTQEGGFKVLEELKSRLKPGGVIFVSTPAIWIEQGAAHGNEHETHRSLWNEALLSQCGFTIIRAGNPCQYKHRMIVAEYIKK